MEDRKQHFYEQQKKKICQIRILYPMKISFKNKGETKTKKCIKAEKIYYQQARTPGNKPDPLNERKMVSD